MSSSATLFLAWQLKTVYIFQEAFSLLAYTDPWSSPVGYILDPVQRESICSSLNSAILGNFG